jgi:Gas vesicle synthesis protein GvpL/GvpF
MAKQSEKTPSRAKSTRVPSRSARPASVSKTKAPVLRKAAGDTGTVAAPPALKRVEHTSTPRGKYVYCIIHSSDPLRFGAIGIGEDSPEVQTINYRNLAAVVSDVPIGVLDSTRDNVLSHERVNETVMRDHTVIPMSFGTIFKTRDDIVELLRSAYDAFGDVLAKMQNKLEFGLKVLWERDVIVKEIEQEDEDIHRLKNELSSQKGSTYFARMQYGRAIDGALQTRSERYVAEIVEKLRDVSVASRINKPIGDKMILNAAFLISRDQEAAFDQRVKEIAAKNDKLTFKYTGPWPPYNFVNIRLKLERV